VESLVNDSCVTALAPADRVRRGARSELFAHGESPSGSGISDAPYLRVRTIRGPLSESFHELFRLGAEPPERPADRGLLPLGRRVPGFRQAVEDAVLVRCPTSDLDESFSGQSAEVGGFPGRLKR
jgi:hypothetical protein